MKKILKTMTITPIVNEQQVQQIIDRAVITLVAYTNLKEKYAKEFLTVVANDLLKCAHSTTLEQASSDIQTEVQNRKGEK